MWFTLVGLLGLSQASNCECVCVDGFAKSYCVGAVTTNTTGICPDYQPCPIWPATISGRMQREQELHSHLRDRGFTDCYRRRLLDKVTGTHIGVTLCEHF